MPKFKVLLTDYAWSNLDIERETLAAIDAELIVAPSGDVATLTALAADADAIMTNWAKVPAAVIDVAAKCRIGPAGGNLPSGRPARERRQPVSRGASLGRRAESPQSAQPTGSTAWLPPLL
jgi:hypothetical protein